MTLTSYGANTNKELISDGLKHAVVIKCGSKAEFGSFTKFKALMKPADRTWDGDKSVKFTDPQYGTFEVIDADSFLLNEKEVAYDARDQFLLKRTELVRV